jgi:hypothetical protein
VSFSELADKLRVVPYRLLLMRTTTHADKSSTAKAAGRLQSKARPMPCHNGPSISDKGAVNT